MTEPSNVALRFDTAPPEQPVRLELSAVVQIGRDLWLAADEGANIERLSPLEPGRYGAHASFPLAELVELPDADDEVDIEGMDYDRGCLWLVGSHAARRRSPNLEAGDEPIGKRIRRLARTSRRGNQHLLARIPLNPATGTPEAGAVLPARPRRNALRDALRDDRHLAPFLAIPGKDNGFNVEGLVVRGERAWLGLRGPVLHGWAVVLVVSPAGDDELELAPLERKDRLYEKHFLDLRGLGVRDLAADGSDLLILAGPTMQLDGDAAVFRWREGLAARGDSLVERAGLEKVLDLPYGRGEQEGVDHPEGLALLRDEDGAASLLVVHDSPSERRREGEDTVLADRYPL